MEYFAGGESIATRYGGSVCAPDGRSHDYDVDLDPYSDPGIEKVEVQLQSWAANGSWNVVGSQTVTIDE